MFFPYQVFISWVLKYLENVQDMWKRQFFEQRLNTLMSLCFSSRNRMHFNRFPLNALFSQFVESTEQKLGVGCKPCWFPVVRLALGEPSSLKGQQRQQVHSTPQAASRIPSQLTQVPREPLHAVRPWFSLCNGGPSCFPACNCKPHWPDLS